MHPDDPHVPWRALCARAAARGYSLGRGSRPGEAWYTLCPLGAQEPGRVARLSTVEVVERYIEQGGDEVSELRCYICKQYKSPSDFYADKSHPNGLMSRCKSCQNAQRKTLPSYNRPYRERNITAHGKNVAAWRRRYPEHRKAQRERRRARLRGAKGVFTGRQWAALCARYDWRCLRCGQRKPLTPDHIVPLSLGGSNDITNIQPLCGPCNYSKGAKAIDYRAHPAEAVEQLRMELEAA